MPNTVAKIAKSGFAGCCSVYLIFFGIFTLLPGGALVGTSLAPEFQDEFFQSGNRIQRILGIICLIVSATCLITGTFLCIYLCKNVSQLTNESSHTQQGVVYQSNVVYGPKPGEIVTPYGNPVGGVQQINPVLPNVSGNNISSYPSTYPPMGGPNITSGAGYPNTSGFGGYQHTPHPAVYPYPEKSDGTHASQVQNLPVGSSLSGNVEASAPYYEQNNQGSMCPPSYIEATTSQSNM